MYINNDDAEKKVHNYLTCHGRFCLFISTLLISCRVFKPGSKWLVLTRQIDRTLEWRGYQVGGEGVEGINTCEDTMAGGESGGVCSIKYRLSHISISLGSDHSMRTNASANTTGNNSLTVI